MLVRNQNASRRPPVRAQNHLVGLRHFVTHFFISGPDAIEGGGDTRRAGRPLANSFRQLPSGPAHFGLPPSLSLSRLVHCCFKRLQANNLQTVTVPVTRTNGPQYRYSIRVIRYRIRVNLPGHEPVRCPGNPSDSELSVPPPAGLRRIGSRGKPCHGLGGWTGPRGSQDQVETVACPTTWSLPVRGRQALAGTAALSPKRSLLGSLAHPIACRLVTQTLAAWPAPE